MKHTQLTEDYIKANDLRFLEAEIVRSVCAWNRYNLTDDGLEDVVTRYLEILKCRPEWTTRNKTVSSAREVETLGEATNTKSAGAAEAAESTETSTTTRCTETTESNDLRFHKARLVRSLYAWRKGDMTDYGLESDFNQYLEILKHKSQWTKKKETVPSAGEVETLGEATESNALSILKREAKELRYMATALEYRVKSVIAENQLHTKK